MKTILAPFAVILVTGFLAHAEPVTIQLPVETQVYKSASGADLANAQCLACHSADYAAMQPPMPAKFWRGTVDKMIGKYGAPVPAEQVDAIVDYFSKNYGTESTNASTLTMVTNKPGALVDAKTLMQSSGCFNCHTVENKLVGPAFKAVAEKYKGNPEALAKVSHQITHGGSGLWGPLPMPPFKQLSDVEVSALSAWILGQK